MTAVTAIPPTRTHFPTVGLHRSHPIWLAVNIAAGACGLGVLFTVAMLAVIWL